MLNIYELANRAAELTKAKYAAVHTTGDPLPHDWNMPVNEPTKENGGIPTYGREAWDSSNKGYMKSKADKHTYDKAFHTARGRKF